MITSLAILDKIEQAKGKIAQAKTAYRSARKAAASVAGVLATVVALGILPSPVDRYAGVALAVLTGLGVYRAKNAPVV